MIYGSLQGFKDYHSERGNALPVGVTDPVISAALLRGSEWIDNSYRTRFGGLKLDGRSQVREWPRTDACDREGLPIPSDSVPPEVDRATYEASLRELQDAGSLSPDFTPNTQIKSAAVFQAVNVEFTSAVGVNSAKPILTIVDGILQPILTNLSGSQFVGKVVRR